MVTDLISNFNDRVSTTWISPSGFLYIFQFSLYAVPSCELQQFNHRNWPVKCVAVRGLIIAVTKARKGLRGTGALYRLLYQPNLCTSTFFFCRWSSWHVFYLKGF